MNLPPHRHPACDGITEVDRIPGVYPLYRDPEDSPNGQGGVIGWAVELSPATTVVLHEYGDRTDFAILDSLERTANSYAPRLYAQLTTAVERGQASPESETSP